MEHYWELRSKTTLKHLCVHYIRMPPIEKGVDRFARADTPSLKQQ